MNEARVSIVIPAFNAAGWIERAIESVLAQDWPCVEIIVVNDGSTDDTEDICLSYGDRIRYCCQENQGICAARNAGIALCTGEVVGFLDSDDEYHPHMISTLMEALAKFPLAAVASAAYRHVTTAGARREPSVGVALGADSLMGLVDDFFRVYARHSIAWTGSILIRRSVFNQIGPFRLDLSSIGEDQEMWSRIAGTFSWAYVDREVSVYNHLPESSETLNPDNDSVPSRLLCFLYDEQEMHARVRQELWAGYATFRRDRALSACRWLLVRGKSKLIKVALRKAHPVRANLELVVMKCLGQLPPRVSRGVALALRSLKNWLSKRWS